MAAALALTLGEPAGIGPDITLAAWHRRAEFGLPAFYAVADPEFLARRAQRLGLGMGVAEVEPEAAAAAFASALPVVALDAKVTAEPGRPDTSSGPAAIASIRRAVADVTAGRAAALVTNPVAKAVLYQAGFPAPGHTEYLAQLAQHGADKPPRTAMMLWSPQLAVVPVTIHVPLREVPGRLSVALIVETARILARDLAARFGIARPRLVVAGLNPHAGEAGALGAEDRDIVAPGVEPLGAEGLHAPGAPRAAPPAPPGMVPFPPELCPPSPLGGGRFIQYGWQLPRVPPPLGGGVGSRAL